MFNLMTCALSLSPVRVGLLCQGEIGRTPWQFESLGLEPRQGSPHLGLQARALWAADSVEEALLIRHALLLPRKSRHHYRQRMEMVQTTRKCWALLRTEFGYTCADSWRRGQPAMCSSHCSVTRHFTEAIYQDFHKKDLKSYPDAVINLGRRLLSEKLEQGHSVCPASQSSRV